MKDILFKGVGTAIATPFDSNGVNLLAFKKLLQFQLDNNIDSIVVCGTTGEAATLTDAEKISVIQCAVDFVNNYNGNNIADNSSDKRKNKVPIIVGCGSNDTKQAVSNAKMAQTLGADGLLIVTPYYNKCTRSGLNFSLY